MEREKEIEKQKERDRENMGIKPSTYHRCFCKPFDPQGTERKSDFIMCMNDSVCDLFSRTVSDHKHVFCLRSADAFFF